MALSRVERRRQQAHRDAATLTAIERAQAALKAADRFLAIAAEQQRQDKPSVEEGLSPVSKPRPIQPRPTRKQLRERGMLGIIDVEITGVIAQGTAPTDYLSWDTTSLPVIARPKKR